MNFPKSIPLWLLIAWVVLVIVDMWFDVVTTATFIKISVTIGLLMVVGICLSISQRSDQDKEKNREE